MAKSINSLTNWAGTTLLAAALSCTFVVSANAQVDHMAEYKKSATKVYESSVRSNMRTLQVAAIGYSIDHDGKYPVAVDNAFKSFFMGGKEDNKTPGKQLFNPFTNTDFWPVTGKPSDVAILRKGQPFAIAPGNIIYMPINNGKDFAIVGGGANGQPITERNSSKRMILDSSAMRD
ncbi:MAG: hypothetical protein K2X81_09730 [Candidatus Obscuribacterales bacterium]|nr:hypothetical protein [Candidatus Obscuribacterales bacterium]